MLRVFPAQDDDGGGDDEKNEREEPMKTEISQGETTDDTDCEEPSVWAKVEEDDGNPAIFRNIQSGEILTRDPTEIMAEGEEYADFAVAATKAEAEASAFEESREKEEPNAPPLVVEISTATDGHHHQHHQHLRRPSSAVASSLMPTMAVDPVDDLPFETDADHEVLCFTKFPTYDVREFFGAKPRGRVGVPGAPSYDYKSAAALFAFGGTSFQAALTSPSFFFHLLLFSFFLTLHVTFGPGSPTLQGMVFNASTKSTVQSLCIFTLVFFTSRVFSRYNERFHDCCRTNGGVTVVTAVCTGGLAGTHSARRKAVSVIRYTNAILRIYYMLISGGLDDRKWRILAREGILTASEIAQLKRHGSPGVVVMAWAVNVLRAAVRQNEMTDRMAAEVEKVGSGCALKNKLKLKSFISS